MTRIEVTHNGRVVSTTTTTKTGRALERLEIDLKIRYGARFAVTKYTHPPATANALTR